MQFLPATNADTLRDQSGNTWTSLLYNEQGWKTGSLRQKNPTRPYSTALYRLHFSVSGEFSKNYKAELEAEGDDGLTIWLDGFELKRWGSGKDSRIAMRTRIDITDRLGVGSHILAVQLDNGVGESMINCSLNIYSTGSAEDLKSGTFYDALQGDDELERQRILDLAHQLYQQKPNDKLLAEYCLRSYTRIDPINAEAAHQLAKDLISRNVHALTSVVLDQLCNYGEYEEASRVMDTLDWQNATGWYDLYKARIALAQNDFSGAAFSLKKAISASESAALGWIPDMLRAGEIAGASPLIRKDAEVAEKTGFDYMLLRSGKNFLTIGDYPRAKKMFTSLLQVKRSNALEPLADFESRLGNWEVAEQLYREAISSTKVTPTRGQSIHLRLSAKLAEVLAVSEKSAEIKDVVAKTNLTVSPNQPEFTLTAIRTSLIWRLRIAAVYGNQEAYAKEAIRLYNAIQIRKSRCDCNDVDMDILVDLAEALDATNRKAEARSVCALINKAVPNVSLPDNQRALAKAAFYRGDTPEAKARINEALLLAPDDVKIKKTAQEIRGLNR